MTKLSIITINLNNLSGLQKTMQSVFAQTFTDYEYIIIDGGSTDGSKDLIKNHENKLVYWVSEKDNGIYNAMNKGIAKANGEYLLFLNSGDYFLNSSTIKDVSVYLTCSDIVYGNLQFRKKDGKEIIKEFTKKIDFNFFLSDSLPHPASFIKRQLLCKVGLYDESFRICSDYKFFMDAVFKHNCSTRHMDITVTSFGLDGISSLEKSSELFESEKENILKGGYSEWMDLIERIHKYEKLIQNIGKSRLFRVLKKVGFFREIQTKPD